jgi:hypothetical protein
VEYTPPEPLLVVEVDTDVSSSRAAGAIQRCFGLRLDLRADEVASATQRNR